MHSKNDRPPGIPKVIMQTWKTKHLPQNWQASQDAILRLMPDWKYVLLTDADNLAFVKEHFPSFLKTFLGFEYDIQRADAIRYMWLYVHGGIYLDLDIKILKPLDPLFPLSDNKVHDKVIGANKQVKKDLYVIKSSIMSNVYTNAFMAAEPGLPVMLQCLELMKAGNSWWHYGKHLKVINLTGPHMFTQAIELAKADIKTGHTFQVHEITTELIIPCSMCETGQCKVDGAYCEILGGSSWSSTDTQFLLTLHCNRKALASTFLILLVIIVVLTVKIKNKR